MDVQYWIGTKAVRAMQETDVVGLCEFQTLLIPRDESVHSVTIEYRTTAAATSSLDSLCFVPIVVWYLARHLTAAGTRSRWKKGIWSIGKETTMHCTQWLVDSLNVGVTLGLPLPHSGQTF